MPVQAGRVQQTKGTSSRGVYTPHSSLYRDFLKPSENKHKELDRQRETDRESEPNTDREIMGESDHQ